MHIIIFSESFINYEIVVTFFQYLNTLVIKYITYFNTWECFLKLLALLGVKGGSLRLKKIETRVYQLIQGINISYLPVHGPANKQHT